MAVAAAPVLTDAPPAAAPLHHGVRSNNDWGAQDLEYDAVGALNLHDDDDFMSPVGSSRPGSSAGGFLAPAGAAATAAALAADAAAKRCGEARQKSSSALNSLACCAVGSTD